MGFMGNTKKYPLTNDAHVSKIFLILILEYLGHDFTFTDIQGLLEQCDIWGPTKGMGAMADAPSAVPPLVLPHCKMWWSPSPGTTCWRWDWAELLLFVPLAPGFHKSLFLTLKEWFKLQMQSGQAEASIGIYGMVIYTGERGEGSKELPVQYLSPHPSSSLLPLFWGFAGLLKVLCSVETEEFFFFLIAV